MQETNSLWPLHLFVGIINLGIPGSLLLIALSRMIRIFVLRLRGTKVIGEISDVQYEDGWFDTTKHYPVVSYTTSDGQEQSWRYYRATNLFKLHQQVVVYHDPAQPHKYIIYSWKAFVGPLLLLLFALVFLYRNLPVFLSMLH